MYLKGNEIIQDITGDRIKKLTRSAAITSLFTIGALVLTLFVAWLLKKGVNPLLIIIVIF